MKLLREPPVRRRMKPDQKLTQNRPARAAAGLSAAALLLTHAGAAETTAFSEFV